MDQSDVPSTEFGIQSSMYTGLTTKKCELQVFHPLEKSEKQWRANELSREMAILRGTQGLHAPLRSAMERKCFSSRPLRIAGLRSSDLMQNILDGKEDQVEFSDFLGTQPESVGEPHLLMEKSLRLF